MIKLRRRRAGSFAPAPNSGVIVHKAGLRTGAAPIYFLEN
jgi:hypothetical protein